MYIMTPNRTSLEKWAEMIKNLRRVALLMVSETAGVSSPTVSTLPFPLAIEAQLTLRLGLTLFHAGPKASCTVHLISQSRRR